VSEIHDLLLGLGLILVLMAVPAIVWPHKHDSLRNRDARLRELGEGADAAYFEGRRELEAYPPRFNPSNDAIRKFASAQPPIGLTAVFWSLSQ
jgi:hypothetical protein